MNMKITYTNLLKYKTSAFKADFDNFRKCIKEMKILSKCKCFKKDLEFYFI